MVHWILFIFEEVIVQNLCDVLCDIQQKKYVILIYQICSSKSAFWENNAKNLSFLYIIWFEFLTCFMHIHTFNHVWYIWKWKNQRKY